MRPEQLYLATTAIRNSTGSFVACLYVPYLLTMGLTFGDIFWANVSFLATIAVTELFTGILADRYGRGMMVRVGTIINALGYAAYAYIEGFRSALVAEAIVGISCACISGADQAWLASALKKQKREKEFSTHIGTAEFWKMITGGLASMLGIWLCLQTPRLGYIFAALLSISAWTLTQRMDTQGEDLAHEPSSESTKRLTLSEFIHHVADQFLTMLTRSRVAISTLLSDPWIRWLAAIRAIQPVNIAFNYGWAVYFAALLPRYQHGYLFALMMLVNGFGGRTSKRFDATNPRAVAMSILLCGVGLLLLSVYTSSLMLAVPIVLFMQFFRGMTLPLAEAAVQERAQDEHRATAGSLVSMWGSLSATCIAIGFGSQLQGSALADTLLSWNIAGSALIVSGVILWLCRPKG